MRYGDKDEESRNVEDRRGQRGGGMFGGGRGFRIPMGRGGRGGFSLTTLLIIGAVMLFFGINPLDLLRGGAGGGGGIQMPQMPRLDPGPRRVNAPGNPRTGRSPFDIPGLPGSRPAPGGTSAGSSTSASSDAMKTFTARVLKDTEIVWHRVFRSFGKTYREPKLVMFTGGTRTACGIGQSAMGPFYCPLDQKIYVDLRFYEELKRKFRAPGDFAQAYVIAHEVGHHVQMQLGIATKVQQMKKRVGKREGNQLQVKMELQADCLAGVWANLTHQIKNRLEPGDIDEGLNAATAIGDDMIQKRTTGYVVPDAFTHGSAEQRVRWFRKGLDSGRIQDCDSFGAGRL